MALQAKQLDNKMTRALTDAELKLNTTINEYETNLHKLKQTLSRQIQRAREAHERQVRNRDAGSYTHRHTQSHTRTALSG